jgi:hypothetical protein
MKAIKFPVKKILSLHTYNNAIQIIEDRANAVPHIFTVDDPFFAADVIARLHNFENPNGSTELKRRKGNV